MALTIMLVARSAGKLVTRFGVRAVLGGGLMMMTAGMLLFTKIAAGGSTIVTTSWSPGCSRRPGSGCRSSPRRSPPPRAPSRGRRASPPGLVNTSRQIGGGLGIAVLITLATSRSSHLIGHGTRVPQALTDGFRLAYYIGAGLCAAAALADVRARCRGRRRKGSLTAAVPDRARGRARSIGALRRARLRVRRLARRADRRVHDQRHLQLRVGAGRCTRP